MKVEAPERIWATVNGMRTSMPGGGHFRIGGWSEYEHATRAVEYVRADKLEELAAALAEKDKEIVELREAVEPFSRLASVLCAGDADDAIVIVVSAGDLRRLVNACRVREGGKSETCPECGGKGNAQPVASTNLA